MPILNFAQDSLDILGHRASPQAGVDDRDRRRCDLVSKISPRSDWIRELGIETDFVVAHSPALKDDGGIAVKIIDLGLAKAITEPSYQTAISTVSA